MTELAPLQRAFQRALLDHDRGAITSCIAGGDERESDSRLAIYEHAYASRLHAALESNYPLLARWIGADVFAQLARDFIEVHPSNHFSIRYFGETLSPWIAQHFHEHPWMAEFAQWEWALGKCFDGPDREALEPQALADLSPHRWPSLRFGLHPATNFFTSRTNAPQIYKALADDREPPNPEVTAPCHWILWRRDLAPSYRSVDIDEHDALQALRAGATFEELCTIIGEHRAQDTASRAASLLREWLNAHLLCAVDMTS